MAQFEGTIREFTKFIGPYSRLKVAFLAAKLKKQIGKCEDCGRTDSLDAAHVKGKGRALLISGILSEFVEDNIIRVELNEFEQKFIDAHLPIDSTIRILCKDCHRSYDRVEKDKTLRSIKEEANDEGEVIESLIVSQMNKGKAMKLAYNRNLINLTNANTIFSNITTQESWWLQTHNDKFKELLHIILNDNRSNQLYIFSVPANSVTNPPSHFKQRNDRYRTECSDIFIPTSGLNFKEKNGFDFTEFLIDTILY